MNVHFSAARSDWATPQWVFAKICETVGVEPVLDVCAEEHTAKCPVYYTKEDNALVKPWASDFWMNPPYGREVGNWVQRATQQVVVHGVRAVCLLPARTDTRWWHEYVMDCAAQVYFTRGRIKFECDDWLGETHPAPFPSAVVLYVPEHAGPPAFRPLNLRG